MPGGRGVRVPARQAHVEVVDRLVIVPEREKWIRIRIAVIPALGDQPTGPGCQVGDGRYRYEEEERHGPLPERGIRKPPPDPGASSCQGIDHDEVDAQRRQDVEARPFHCGRGTERDAGGQDPRTRPQHRSPARRVVAGCCERDSGLHPVAIDQDEPERQQHEEHQEAIEQSDSAEDDPEPIHGEKESGDAGPDGRTRQAAGDENQDQHGRGTRKGGRKAPSPGRVRAEDRPDVPG